MDTVKSDGIKAALPVWRERIAPVFDVARQVRVAQIDDGRVSLERDEPLPEADAAAKVERLRDLGVSVLICGGISRPIEALAAAYGIEVVPFVAGGAREVVEAWLRGTLLTERYSMPGCLRGPGRRGGVRRCRGGRWSGRAQDGRG